MRICYISTYPPTECGIATYTKYLSDEVEKNKEVIILSQITGKGKNVFPVYYPDDKDIAYKLFSLISKLTPDIVHIQHEFGLFGCERGVQIIDFLVRCKIANVPVVTTLHTVYKTPAHIERIITEKILELSTEIIVHENHQKEYIIEEYKVKTNIHVLHHGVRKVKFIENAKKKLNLENKKVILLAGYFRTTKHFEKLIELFPEILKKNKDAVILLACRLRVLEQNELFDQLLKIFKFSEESSNIKILKGQFPQHTLDTIMSAADVVVMPYSDGAQSGMLAQFSAFKIPCVTSDLLSFKLWNQSSKGGLNSFTDKDYINNILKIINNDDLAENMRKNIANSNNDRYWNVISKKHISIYENIIEPNKNISEFCYFHEK